MKVFEKAVISTPASFASQDAVIATWGKDLFLCATVIHIY